jgi:hypothetical protein
MGTVLDGVAESLLRLLDSPSLGKRREAREAVLDPKLIDELKAKNLLRLLNLREDGETVLDPESIDELEGPPYEDTEPLACEIRQKVFEIEADFDQGERQQILLSFFNQMLSSSVPPVRVIDYLFPYLRRLQDRKQQLSPKAIVCLERSLLEGNERKTRKLLALLQVTK